MKPERQPHKLYYKGRIDRTEWRCRCQRQHEVLHLVIRSMSVHVINIMKPRKGAGWELPERKDDF